jgi:phosphate transport system substrate-binding protein
LNRFAISCLWLFTSLAGGRAATNLPPANALLLDDNAAVEITAGLQQYQQVPKLSGKLISIGGGIPTILVNRWLSEFATLYPEAEFDIQGGGSVDGFGKLLLGQADIVPMSRALIPGEISRFKAKYGYEPGEIIVAQDAIGVYVNRSNPLEGLTLAQLEAIYSREPKRGGGQPEFWKDLGVAGALADERIARMSLSHVHGTYIFIRDEIMQGADYRFGVQFETVPSSLVQAVGADAAAIGCASVMFATARTRFVPIQGVDGSFLLPSYQNTASDRYPMVRPMRIAFHRKRDGSMNPVAREFLRFAVSRHGQRIIALAESYPLTAEQQQQALQMIGEMPATAPRR